MLFPNIEFSKKFFGYDSEETSKATAIIGEAITDSSNGKMIFGVKEPLRDTDGDLVPQYDAYGNPIVDEEGQIMYEDNSSEIPNIGNVNKGNTANVVDGVCIGSPGEGDATQKKIEEAGKAGIYIHPEEDGLHITHSEIGEILIDASTMYVKDDIGNILAIFGEGSVIGDPDGLHVTIDNMAVKSMYGSKEECRMDYDGITSRYGGLHIIDYVDLYSENHVDINAEEDVEIRAGENLTIASSNFNLDEKGNISPSSSNKRAGVYFAKGRVAEADISANSYTETAVSFDPPFAKIPTVICNLDSAQTTYIGQCEAIARNVTVNGFTLRRINSHASSSRNFGVNWIAMVV